MASMVPASRGSAAGRKPSSGNWSSAASTAPEPYRWVKLLRSGSKPRSSTSACTWARSRRQRPAGSGSPNRLDHRHRRVRGRPDHALLCTKCRGGARISQMPASGRCQRACRKESRSAWLAGRPGHAGQARRPGGQPGAQQVAERAQLGPGRRGVADPDRLGALIAGQPVGVQSPGCAVPRPPGTPAARGRPGRSPRDRASPPGGRLRWSAPAARNASRPAAASRIQQYR